MARLETEVHLLSPIHAPKIGLNSTSPAPWLGPINSEVSNLQLAGMQCVPAAVQTEAGMTRVRPSLKQKANCGDIHVGVVNHDYPFWAMVYVGTFLKGPKKGSIFLRTHVAFLGPGSGFPIGPRNLAGGMTLAIGPKMELSCNRLGRTKVKPCFCWHCSNEDA